MVHPLQAFPTAGAGEHAIAYVSPSRDNQQIRLVNPDGHQIVFEQSNQLDDTLQNEDLQPILLCPCQLWLINSDGTDAYLFISDGRAPVWSSAPLR